MRSWRMAALAWGFALGPVVACEQVGPSDSGPAPGASGGHRPEVRGEEALPQPLLKDLGPSGRRVKVIVLPGDATVVVDGHQVLRRDGIIELIGKVGDSHRLRVTKGPRFCEEEVTLQEPDAALLTVDLDQCPDAGAARARAPAASSANPLFPEDFR